MPKITDMQIQKNNKPRANVYIDGEFAFGLEMLTVMKLGLKIGREVSEEQLAQAVFDSEKSVAFERAVNYLSRCMKTCKQMREYLTGKGYSPDVVSNVVDRLKELKYLDDETYARLYVEQNSQSKGEYRLKQELSVKGISKALIDKYCVQDGERSVNAAAQLAVKYMKGKPSDVKTLQKLQRYLISRGYGFDTVNQVIHNFKQDDE